MADFSCKLLALLVIIKAGGAISLAKKRHYKDALSRNRDMEEVAEE